MASYPLQASSRVRPIADLEYPRTQMWTVRDPCVRKQYLTTTSHHLGTDDVLRTVAEGV